VSFERDLLKGMKNNKLEGLRKKLGLSRKEFIRWFMIKKLDAKMTKEYRSVMR